MTQTFLFIMHFVVTLLLIGVILIQKSDGAGLALGQQMGGGMMTPQGGANFLTRFTAILATLFMVNCLLISYWSSRPGKNASVLDAAEQQASSADEDVSAEAPSTDDAPIQTPENHTQNDTAPSSSPAADAA